MLTLPTHEQHGKLLVLYEEYRTSNHWKARKARDFLQGVMEGNDKRRLLKPPQDLINKVDSILKGQKNE